MLPPDTTKYMPHVGLVLLLLGFVFGIVATVDSSSRKDPIEFFESQKWSILSNVLILTGGFLLVAGSLR